MIIAGASGLIGTALDAFLLGEGHRVDRLVRRPPQPGTTEIRWDPARGQIDTAALEGADAVVNLAGEDIAAGRWTASRKEAILKSRVDSTRLLSRTIAGLTRRPDVLINASAVGYYGDRGDEILTEASGPGAGFLPEVCKAWEDATDPARRADIRVVNLRIGIVLSAAGGALARMLPPFKMGAGGRLGSGRQYISWVAIDDLIRAIDFLMLRTEMSGPVNAVSPNPVTNAEFTKTLGRVLERPTFLPLPAFAVRLKFGEMGQSLLLEGARLQPAKLQAAGFRFLHPQLEETLRSELAA